MSHYHPNTVQVRQAEEARNREANRVKNMLGWAVSTYPQPERKTIREQLKNVPLGLLTSFHPLIWEHGPRGQIYAQQVDTIKTHMDNFHAGKEDITWLSEFEIGAVEINNLLTLSLRASLQHTGVQWGFPPVMSTTNRDETDLLYKLVYHPIFDGSPSPNFALAARTFRTATLYFPILTRLESKDAVAAAFQFEKVCIELRIPNE